MGNKKTATTGLLKFIPIEHSTLHFDEQNAKGTGNLKE